MFFILKFNNVYIDSLCSLFVNSLCFEYFTIYYHVLKYAGLQSAKE